MRLEPLAWPRLILRLKEYVMSETPPVHDQEAIVTTGASMLS